MNVIPNAIRCLGVLALSLLGLPFESSEAQNLASDTFVVQVRGDWDGTGVYEGNTLNLSRSWELVLGDQFLCADMRVGMPNGFSFGAVMYWKLVADAINSCSLNLVISGLNFA